MATTRVTTTILGLAVLLALTGCSSGGGLYGDCGTCAAPAPACAPPACAPVPDCAPPVAACDTATPRPPDARPGEVWCYVRIPALTRTVCEQVCVQPASCRQEWVEPEYTNVQEQVCVKPAETRRIPIPARYETVSEQVMVCPGKTEWRRVDCEPKSLGEGEQVGECWTLCEVPPVYETRCKQVCVQPESCREEVVPAVYETRCKQVCSREGYYKNVEVPAVYDTVSREEVCQPARWEWRRTTECEIPENTCVYPAGQPAASGPMAPAMGSPDAGGAYGSPDAYVPGSPDGGATLPPAGTLPEADPFAPSR